MGRCSLLRLARHGKWESDDPLQALFLLLRSRNTDTDVIRVGQPTQKPGCPRQQTVRAYDAGLNQCVAEVEHALCSHRSISSCKPWREQSYYVDDFWCVRPQSALASQELDVGLNTTYIVHDSQGDIVACNPDFVPASVGLLLL